GPYGPDSQEYEDSLRRVFEPIVHQLDILYARSRMVFLAWPADGTLQEERERIQLEIEARELRVYPEAIGEYESEVRLRNASEESATSVHFLGIQRDDFAESQFQMAVQVGK